jgi:hypothetical protein
MPPNAFGRRQALVRHVCSECTSDCWCFTVGGGSLGTTIIPFGKDHGDILANA